jgi:hypothetical protein
LLESLPLVKRISNVLVMIGVLQCGTTNQLLIKHRLSTSTAI